MKLGVNASVHAVIYTRRPEYCNREERRRLTLDPIRVVPILESHSLDKASRINYGKPYKVDHNVKVWFIGNVDPDSLSALDFSFANISLTTESRREYANSKSYETKTDSRTPHFQTPQSLCTQVSATFYTPLSSYSSEKPASSYTSDMSPCLVSAGYGQPHFTNDYPAAVSGYPSSAYPAAYPPSAQSPSEMQGDDSNSEERNDDTLSNNESERIVKRSEESAVPYRYPKSGQRYKQQTDEGEFSLP